MFKVGDRVRCIAPQYTSLSTEKYYIVTSYEPSKVFPNNMYLTLEGKDTSYFSKRFELAKRLPKNYTRERTSI